MQHFFQTAFVTPSHNSLSSSNSPFNSGRLKVLSKQTKRMMEEIQIMKRKALEYLEHLARCDVQSMDQALQNLSLRNDVLRLNIVQLSPSAATAEIDTYYNYLHQTLLKLNSIGKQVKRINRCRNSSSTRKSVLPGDSKASLNQTDAVKQKTPEKSKTQDEKMLNHIKLLFKRSLQGELERRDKQQEIQNTEHRVRDNIKKDLRRKRQEKNKRFQQLALKRKILQQQMRGKQQQKHQKIQRKMAQTQHGQRRPFTKILDYRERVMDNRAKIESQFQMHLQQLQQKLEQKHDASTDKLSVSNRLESRQKEFRCKQAQQRKLQREKSRQRFFLTSWIEKSKYIESLGASPLNKSVKKGEAPANKSGFYQQQTPAIQTVSPPIKKQPTRKPINKKSYSQNSLKRENILKDITQTLQKKHALNRQRLQKNRIQRQMQQQSKVSSLNNTYHSSVRRVNLAHESRDRRHDRYIYESFKVRKQQDMLHQQLNRLLSQSSSQIRNKLDYIDSNGCDMLSLYR